MNPQLQFDPVVIAAVEDVGTRQLTVAEQAQTIRIADAESAALAGTLLATIRARIKEATEACGPLKAAAHESHKQACALEARIVAPWKTAEAALKREIAAYDERCEAERREQERLAAIERKRLEDERRAAEAEETRRRQAESDAATLQLAEIAESVGDTEGAARILEHAPIVAPLPREPLMPPPVAVAPRAKVPGAAIKKVWRYRILDEKRIARAYLCPDVKKLAKIVEALGPDAAATVGAGALEIYEERQVAGRSR